MEDNIKRSLLRYVNEIGDEKDFWKYMGPRELGSSNIRGLASIVLNAECYEEIKLFINYKTAKGLGWDKTIKGKKFGDLIVEYMEKIKNESNNENEAIQNISKFFGYLYWKSRTLEKGDK